MSKGGREKTITLEDDDPNAVQQMIDYLYKLDFDYYYTSEVKCKDYDLQLLDVYILAVKYDIPGLRKWCRLAFEEETCKRFWTSASLLALADAAWKSLPSNHKGLLKDIIKECARYICDNLEKLNKRDQKLKRNENIAVPESKGEPQTEQQNDSDGASSERNLEPLSSNRWKDLLEDRDFTTRLRQAMIQESKHYKHLHPKYPWLPNSRDGENKDTEPTLEDLQRYLEMYPYSSSTSK